MANYACKKFFPALYLLAAVPPLQTDGRTTTMKIARPLLKCDRL